MSEFIEAVQKHIKPEKSTYQNSLAAIKHEKSTIKLSSCHFLITTINQQFLPISPISPGNHQSDSSCQFRHWLVISNDHENLSTV